MNDEKKKTDEQAAVAKLQQQLAEANTKAAGLSKALGEANKNVADLGSKLAKAQAQLKAAQESARESKEAEVKATRRADAAESELAAAVETIATLEQKKSPPEPEAPSGTIADALAASKKPE